jgi:hypothetical protein
MLVFRFIRNCRLYYFAGIAINHPLGEIRFPRKPHAISHRAIRTARIPSHPPTCPETSFGPGNGGRRQQTREQPIKPRVWLLTIVSSSCSVRCESFLIHHVGITVPKTNIVTGSSTRPHQANFLTRSYDHEVPRVGPSILPTIAAQ